MARESCNLDKDEAEILKPSSSPSPSPSAPTPPVSSPIPLPPSLFPKPCEDCPNPIPETPGAEAPLMSSSSLNPDEESKSKPKEERKPPVRYSINRCSTCRKKVGLTGFRCRCGDLFCGSHRYSDTHDCSFDYKAFGRDQIAKANPLVRAAKIIKI